MILALLIAASPCQPPAPDAQVKVSFKAGATLDDLDRFMTDVLCLTAKTGGGKKPLTLAIEGTVFGRQLPALIRVLAESAGAGLPTASPPEPVAPCPPLPRGSITPVDPWTRKVSAAARDQLLACGATQLRLVPHFVEGKAQGFKLFAIRPEGLPAELGLQNGDVVTAVNGMTLNSPAEALEAYAQAKDAPEVKLSVTRKGEPRTITWQVR